MTKQLLLVIYIIFLLTLSTFVYSKIPFVNGADWTIAEQNGLARLVKINFRYVDEIRKYLFGEKKSFWKNLQR